VAEEMRAKKWRARLEELSTMASEIKEIGKEMKGKENRAREVKKRVNGGFALMTIILMLIVIQTMHGDRMSRP
jgi:hypothetical protein